MGRDRVQVTGRVAAEPEKVWALLRDFCGLWHPWMESITAERDPRGALIRAFTVKGEATLYREQLTYFSDTDRVLGYTHLEGIAGCEAYDARVTVTDGSEGGAMVSWSAVVRAPAARLAEICEGTKAVFEAGIAVLETVSNAARPQMSRFEVIPTAETKALLVDDLPRLGLTTAGGPGKRLCLFLHGIGGNRDNWDLQLNAASAVMPAAALDLRGYGESTLGPRQSTVDDYCDDILRVMQVIGAERLVLVGLSYGSWIATSFAMRHPQLLDGLVLSGGCTGMSEAGPDEREAFRISREVPLNAGQTPKDFAPAVVKVLAGPNASEAIRQKLYNSMAAIPAETYRDALVCFTNPLEQFDFSKLTMPVLMMTGEHDRLAPPDEIRGVAGRIWDAALHADVRFEVIKDAGHLCNVEQPGAYNRVLTDFLRKLP
ncbi:alpha/beta fold hydrolase [Xinfangfangia sp. CPCC 101601]|uniref:Alpha/beta fold hydrolase n=1 Tax=Pseudogemmobacter lacusdianii TaxID=3069608 RepID=A0ABU0VU53_9RHOB|nr:alpha/beta fold hydrolase [Xinfangfangia sp. CPCC 101601]MDQ2065259.1 alpha/beta fold hydrolase [Xinfangfangia sp. CPCC 101601]